MDDEDEPQPPARGWFGWLLVAAGAAGALWLAAYPLDQVLPEQPVRRALTPEPLAAGAPEPESTPPAGTGSPGIPAEPVPEAESTGPPATTPPAEWFEETPGEDVAEEPQAQEALRARLERQLQMNDLGGVRVEVVGDRVVTSGALPSPGDRQRVALLVRSLAPEFVHEDQAFDAGGPP